MGIGYKTSWIAVRDRTPEQVADVLELADREELDYATGTQRAYDDGIYVSTAIGGWVLAHRIAEPADDLAGWLAGLSTQLGDVQFFGTHRVSSYYAWGRANNGQALRVVMWGDSEVTVCEGEPTQEEISLGIGIRSADDTGSMPREESVMKLAGLWSIDPTRIDDESIDTLGLYGMPPDTPETIWLREMLSRIRSGKAA